MIETCGIWAFLALSLYFLGAFGLWGFYDEAGTDIDWLIWLIIISWPIGYWVWLVMLLWEEFINWIERK